MNSDQILEYQNIRTALWLSPISDIEAIGEAHALINLISLSLSYAKQ